MTVEKMIPMKILIKEWKCDTWDIIRLAADGLLNLQCIIRGDTMHTTIDPLELQIAYIKKMDPIYVTRYLKADNSRDKWGLSKILNQVPVKYGHVRINDLFLKASDQLSFKAKHLHNISIEKFLAKLDNKEVPSISSDYENNRVYLLFKNGYVKFKDNIIKTNKSQAKIINFLYNSSIEKAGPVHQRDIFQKAKISNYYMQMSSMFKDSLFLKLGIIIKPQRGYYQLNDKLTFVIS